MNSCKGAVTAPLQVRCNASRRLAAKLTPKLKYTPFRRRFALLPNPWYKQLWQARQPPPKRSFCACWLTRSLCENPQGNSVHHPPISNWTRIIAVQAPLCRRSNSSRDGGSRRDARTGRSTIREHHRLAALPEIVAPQNQWLAFLPRVGLE